MDQLKENRILVAIIAGLVVTAGIYFVLSAGAVGAAEKELKNISQSKLQQLNQGVAAAPTRGEIETRKQQRIALLKSLYDAHRLYGRWSFPLREYLVPGTRKDSSFNDFESRQTVYLKALTEYYQQAARHIPPGAEGEDFSPEADPLSKIEFDEDSVERAQKQFWIVVDLVNALVEAVQAAKDEGNPNPVCVIRRIEFEDHLRDDESGIYVGHEFEMRLALDVDVWPHFRAALHKPARADLFWDPTAERDQAKVIDRRVGVRFDRLAFDARLAPPPDRIEVGIDTTDRAAEIYKEHLPGHTVNGKQIQLPEAPEDIRDDQQKKEAFLSRARDARFAALTSLLNEELLPELAPTSNFINVTVTGEAIDFFAQPDARPFWETLALTQEDIRGVLSEGTESGNGVDEADDRTWPACDVIAAEKTLNKPIQLDPLVYEVAMEIREFSTSEKFKTYNPYSDQFIRLGDTAMQKLVDEIYVRLAGGTIEAEMQ